MEHQFADCTLDDARLTLTRGGSAVAVEPKVFDLIHFLVRNAGDLVTRDRMVDEVWGGADRIRVCDFRLHRGRAKSCRRHRQGAGGHPHRGAAGADVGGRSVG